MIAGIIWLLIYFRKREREKQYSAFVPPPPTPLAPPPSMSYNHPPTSFQSVQPLLAATASGSSFPSSHTTGTRSNSLQQQQPSQANTSMHSSTSPPIPRNNILTVSNPEVEALAYAKGQLHNAGSAKIARPQSAGGSSPAVIPPHLQPPQAAGRPLTEEQAIVVNNLRSLNVPPAEIGRLMDVMSREREAGAIQANPTFDPDAPPPRYDA